MKKCSTCELTKDLQQFVARKDAKDGKTGVCRDCHNKRGMAWRDNNPGRMSTLITSWNIKRAPYRAFKKSFCEECSFKAVDSCQLDVDHVDGNHKNNDISNLKTLCANCHRLKSKQNRNCGRKRKPRPLEKSR